jgi:hypothetical protein
VACLTRGRILLQGKVRMGRYFTTNKVLRVVVFPLFTAQALAKNSHDSLCNIDVFCHHFV